MKRLILQHIPSMDRLELLLLMRQRGEPWTLDALSVELRLKEVLVAMGVDALVDSGFLVAIDGAPAHYQYQPRTPELVSLLDDLAAMFDRNRLWVIDAVNRAALERMKGASARSFADAFRLRPKKESKDG